MKRILSILFGFGMLIAVQQGFGLGSTSCMEAEALTPQEADTLAYLWEQEKHLRDIFILGTECSDNPEMASAAIIEQGHMDLLRELLHYFGLDVPVPSEEVGVFTLFTTEVWSGYAYVCINPDPSIFGNAIMYEELAILNILQAMDSTDRQRLLNVYNYLLVEACAQLRSLVTRHSPGANAEFMSQDLFDRILAGTFPPSFTETFTINAGLNDAWYNPATNGQGFFISVFPDLGTVSLAWFTYDTSLPGEGASAALGDPGQRWLIAQGHYAGSEVIMRVISFGGGLFDTSPPEPEHEEIGSIVLKFEDCNSGSITYNLPVVSMSGVIPISRVAIDNVPVCEAYSHMPAFTE